MVRVLAIFSGLLVMMNATMGQPKDQGPGEFISFYGHHYLTPSPGHPCASTLFNDHGTKVPLCVDSLGVPIKIDPHLIDSAESNPPIESTQNE